MKRLICVLLSLVVVSFVGFNFANDVMNDGISAIPRDANGVINDGSPEPSPVILPKIPPGTIVDACYIRGYDTIDELSLEADIIVVGEVKKQSLHEYGFSIISEFSIQEAYCGEPSSNTIEVLQLNNDNVLDWGKAYILFLKEQGGDRDDEYSVIGGGRQGAFEITGNRLLPIDEIMKADFEKVRSRAEYQESARQGSDVAILKDYVMRRKR